MHSPRGRDYMGLALRAFAAGAAVVALIMALIGVASG
jgi:hypothetical protein